MTAEVGLSQLDTRSPWALPYGTRPDAMPPRHAPRANGVTIDAMAETTSTSRTCRGADVPADAGTRRRGRGAGGGGVRRTGDDDPQRRHDERDREGRRDRAEGGGIGRPGDREHEDQPHVVGLPHGRHDVVGEVADPPPLAGLSGRDLPDGGAEVGAGQDDVARQSDEDEEEWDGRQRHAITSGGGAPGRAGVSTGMRARRRRIHTVTELTAT